MVCELDGPMPILNISKTLTLAAIKTTPNSSQEGGKYTR
jgi:hypothetical protein